VTHSQPSNSFDEQPRVAILLSTYNGEKFVLEQLKSLFGQSYENFLVVTRDDGSTDKTLQLLEEQAEKHPTKLILLPADNKNLGARDSFSKLIEFVLENKTTLGTNKAYMMFCDQDDIWFEEKVETQVAAIIKIEAEHPGLPVLVHTDLQVVSENTAPIAESLIKFQGLEIERNRFPHLVISNLVTGCTALINEELAEIAVPVSNEAIMHDWWMALVASAFGKLIFLDQPLVHYRQHGNNTIGAKEYVGINPLSRSFYDRLFSPRPNKHLYEVAIQATAFRKQFANKLSMKDSIKLRISACMRIRVGFLQRLFYRLARRL
jgi:glycosyltransferase involved in cell wall biosynthesis